MTDENAVDAAPVDADPTPEVEQPPVETHPAHPVNEDPEEHIGEELPDPWEDPEADEAWRKNNEKE